MRAAASADAAHMAEIDARVSMSPRSEKQFQRVCDNTTLAGERALLWQEATQVAGFVVISAVFDEANIHNIAVAPDYQKRGIGGALLQAALEFMAVGGITRCLLEVRESNLAARALYGQFGFELDGVRPRCYPTEQGREDAMLMSRQE